MQMLLNGARIHADMKDTLTRAVIISLFSWRRADGDDQVDGDERMGWWADQFLNDQGDRIGSKLWELTRRSITNETLVQAQEFSEQALSWLVDDGVCNSVSVTAQRGDDVNRIDLTVTLNLSNGNKKVYEILEALNGDTKTDTI